jgi:arylsulfatase A-like enzyme
VLIFLGASRVHAAGPSRPNFLFIYTDDQRWDGMSCVQQEMGDRGRFPWFKTPNMDRLAKEGMRFRNAFVVNSLCSPSRSIFLTGRYSHLNGVANNHTPMPENEENSAKILAANGYATAYVGKFHHDSQKDRPGFQYVASFIGQGVYNDCPFNVNGTITKTKGWVDDVSTDYAIHFMEAQVKDHPDQPFDMVVGFKSPHGPCVPPERAKERFADQHYYPVPNLDVPSIYPPGKAKWSVNRGGTADRQLNYFRTVSAADDCLGKILDTLDRLHLADNTVVIFTTDNGFYLGEHELADKRTAYDESLRIPMLLRWPGHAPAGKVLDQMVLNIDVPETLLDVAGIAIPADMQGLSWKPLLKEDHPKWRDAFFCEYFKERGYDAPQTLAVRTETAKYIEYPGHPEWTELFDLKADPYETHNLVSASGSADLLRQMREKFAEQKAAVKFQVPAYADPQK